MRFSTNQILFRLVAACSSCQFKRRIKPNYSQKHIEYVIVCIHRFIGNGNQSLGSKGRVKPMHSILQGWYHFKTQQQQQQEKEKEEEEEEEEQQQQQKQKQ